LKSSNLTTNSKIGKEAEFESKEQLAFIDLLLRAETEDGHLMSRKDIRDEVSTFMFEVKVGGL
jgi:docosahexaenoic acid omega-hydroxylase